MTDRFEFFSPHFKEKEFTCPCCGAANMDNRLLEKLEETRQALRQPMFLTSAYRCPKHNKEVGGSDTSSHLKGLAVDIACNNTSLRLKLIKALLRCGFNRIGIAESFIHTDCDLTKPPAIWLY